MQRMLKRYVLFSTSIVSVKWVIRWQLGGLEFLSLGYGYIRDVRCPAVRCLTLRRRAMLCKRPCCFAGSPAGAALSGTSFLVGCLGHFNWPEFALKMTL